jgi:hypothetical protein
VTKEELIEFLNRFRWIDKYKTFAGILPAATTASAEDQEQLTAILDACAYDIISLYHNTKRPTRLQIRQIFTTHIDELARTGLSAANKDFGYELFWYLGEKTGTDLRKGSDAKIWGYWKVESGKVKTIGSVRKKRTEKVI